MVPVSGSAYTYAYATLGELVAWLIGWDLILEYAISNAAVAVSWSGYCQTFLRGLHVQLPAWLGTDYRSAIQSAHHFAAALANTTAIPSNLLQGQHVDVSGLAELGSLDLLAFATAPRIFGLPIIFNLPAFSIVLLVTWVVLIGIRETAWLNTALVIGKLAIVLFFLVLGAMYVRPENWTPFAPNGFKGISSAAAIIFFAYIGFDAVSTAAEETRNPQKDMPIGILASLVICTVLYVAVAIVLTGLAKWNTLGNAEPLASVFSALGMNWTAGIIALGAMVATTSALIPYQAGQPRIFFATARDGLLPGWAAKVHPRFRTPHVTTIITGLFVAICSSLANINELVELTNIGTLFAFVLVALGVIILRWKEPERHRPFRTPWVPWVPLAAIATCGYLTLELPSLTWWRFFLWMAAGLIIYLGVGVYESKALGAEFREAALAKLTTMGRKYLIAGPSLMVVGAVAGLGGPWGVRVGVVVAYVGLIFWVRGCAAQALARGYSSWLGLAGLLGPLGLALLVGGYSRWLVLLGSLGIIVQAVTLLLPRRDLAAGHAAAS
jgi:APA family basic amino acid/polyamine antiporter